MATLFNTKIKDTYQSLLKLEDNTILTTTSKNITDGLGNPSPLYMSTTRIGIGTSSPTSTFEVNGTTSLNGQFDVINGGANFRVTSESTSYVALKYNASTWASFNANDSYFQGTQFYFQSGLNFRFAGSGSFGFTSNPSARLQVKGSGSTGSTSSLLVQNSAGVTALEIFDSLTVRSDNSNLFFSNTTAQHRLGLMTFTNNSISCLSVLNIGGNTATTFTNATLSFQTSTTFNALGAPNNATRSGISIVGDFTNPGAGIISVGNNFNITTALNTSVGTVTLNQFNITNAVNTTGGITLQRGFYYNPTLTGTVGFTHRAIETVTGDVLFGTTSGKATFGSGVAGTSYIEIKPGTFAGNNRITFNDFDGGSRGGWLEMSTYSSELIFGNYNSLNIGPSTKKYRLYFEPANQNVIISQGFVAPTDSGALFQVKGSGSTSATSSLLVQNSSSNNTLQVLDDASVIINGNNTSSTTLLRANNSSGNYAIKTLNNYRTDFGYFSSGNTGTFLDTDVSSAFRAGLPSISPSWYAAYFSCAGGDVRVGQATNGTNANPCAILQANSTTQGVLFPRMTTAQKLAIASPVGGLQVYDTTLNQMSYYNGTAWINF
jgi:hypothetical protein